MFDRSAYWAIWRATVAQPKRLVLATVAAAILASLGCGRASAQSAVDFYKDKRIAMVIASDAGGGYDAYARLLSRHLDRRLPGAPTFVVQNMPGAGGLQAANYLYNIAAKDGSAIGGLQRGALSAPLLDPRTDNFQYDIRKFNWIISLNTESGLVIVWHTAEQKTAQDLLATELTVGSSGPATEIFPLFLKNMLGMKLRIISGYKGSRDAYLAMERGEVTGRISTGFDKDILTKWLSEGKVRLLLGLALRPSRYFPDLPLVTEFAKTDEQRQVMELLLGEQVMGRPWAMPPSVPADRVALMRKAFLGTVADSAFLAEAQRLNLDIDAVSGEEMTELLNRIYATPPAVVERARTVITR